MCFLDRHCQSCQPSKGLWGLKVSKYFRCRTAAMNKIAKVFGKMLQWLLEAIISSIYFLRSKYIDAGISSTFPL